MHSSKILEVSQGIGSCLTAIIQNNDNDNIRFYLRDITQAYIKIAWDFNPNFYIRPLSKTISQLSASFDFIVKVIRLLYGKLEANNHRFPIYHPHYKKTQNDKVRTQSLSIPTSIRYTNASFSWEQLVRNGS